MSKTKTKLNKKTNVKPMQYIVLRDGHKIIVPPPGGRFSKRKIEKAVRAVAMHRQEEAKAG